MLIDHVLAVISVVASALCGVCCVAGRLGLRAGACMAAMTIGMIDSMIVGGTLLPPLFWAVVFAALAIVVARDGRCRTPLHRPLHLMAMSLLIAAMAIRHAGGSIGDGQPDTSASTTPSMAGMAHHAGDPAETMLPLLYAAIALAVIFTVWSVHQARNSRGWSRTELVTGAAGVAAMATMTVAM